MVVCHSALSPEGCGNKTRGVVTPKFSNFNIDNTTFVNFDTGTCSALAGCSQCHTFQGGSKIQVKRIKMQNSPNKVSCCCLVFLTNRKPITVCEGITFVPYAFVLAFLSIILRFFIPEHSLCSFIPLPESQFSV